MILFNEFFMRVSFLEMKIVLFFLPSQVLTVHLSLIGHIVKVLRTLKYFKAPKSKENL